MGIVRWVQSRINGRTESKTSHGAAAEKLQQRGALDAGDDQLWPPPHGAGGVLSIGTFGNDEQPAAQELPEFTVDEVKKLQDALSRLLQRARSKSAAAGDSVLPLDRFLNCPSSLEVDRTVQRESAGDDNGDLSPETKIILTKARDLLNDSSSIKNKSFKFLLKKMFVCNGGFVPAPTFKDPVESRMDKFFRTVLSKKINVRPTNAAAAKMYFLEDTTKPKGNKALGDRRHRRRHGEDGEDEHKGDDSYRWDRTDSEFIVLEI